MSTAKMHLQGLRPAALAVSRASAVITKRSRPAIDPVVVYLRSPRVIHVRPEEFMDLVQRLTGNHPTTASSVSAFPDSFTASLPAPAAPCSTADFAAAGISFPTNYYPNFIARS